MAESSGQQHDDDSKSSQKEQFFRYFQFEITALQEQIDRLADFSSTGGERADATDHCLAAIARVSNEVKDASVYLPAYDQRVYSEAIRALQEKLAETKATLAPRQKFSFKSARKSPSAVSLSDAADLVAQRGRRNLGYSTPGSSSNDSSFPPTPNLGVRTPPDQTVLSPLKYSSDQQEAGWLSDDDVPASPEFPNRVRRPTFSTVSVVDLSDESKVHIIVPTAAAHATMPANINRIKSSIVDIAAPTEKGRPFASLTIKNVRKSLLVCGAINGPTHITGVKNSVMVVSCRQFRMHQCKDCIVYLACSSRPIIEDCSTIKFGSYPQHYVTPNSPLPNPNLASEIDDFNWIRSEPSPNWSILAKEDHVPEEVWQDVVPGGPGLGVKGILRAVKLDLT